MRTSLIRPARPEADAHPQKENKEGIDMRTSLAIASLIIGSLSLAPGRAFADGTETLGPPGIRIAQGTGFVEAGIGLVLTRSGTIQVDVPPNAEVRQAILYWEGQHRNTNTGDPNLVVNGQTIWGETIGGPTLFENRGTEGADVNATAFRTDITGYGFIKPGSNTLNVSGAEFDFSNDGAGVLVIYAQNGVFRDIQVRDGVDIAFKPWPSPRDKTVPQTFVFAPADSARMADLSLFVGSVNDSLPTPNKRPNAIRLTVGSAHSAATIQTGALGKMVSLGTPLLGDFAPICYLVGRAAGKPAQTSGTSETLLINQLDSKDGREWDTFRTQVLIPAGASELTVEVISYDDGSGNRPASLTWVAAICAITEAAPPPGGTEKGWMTGGGSVFTADGNRVTHGFRVNCNASQQPNNLEVNWGQGNKFHLEQMTSASCTDDPTIGPAPPPAGFDTHKGAGNGNYNGVPGATVEWTFTDAGEPGTNDRARMVIRDPLGSIVLSVDGKLNKGNQQAHSGGPGGAKSAAAVPTAYRVSQNHPNPFNPSTQIEYQIPAPGNASLVVYNTLGQEVRVLAQGYHKTGRYTVTWDGMDERGQPVSGGVYFYQFSSEGLVEVHRMLLLK